MFSNTPAPKAMLLFPIVLLVTVTLLSFLVFRNLSSANNSTTDMSTSSSMTTSTGTITSQVNSTSSNAQTTQSKDINRDAMSQVPISGFPANTCPAILVIESQSNNYFAIDDGKKYSIKKSESDWIKANCPEVETLNY